MNQTYLYLDQYALSNNAPTFAEFLLESSSLTGTRLEQILDMESNPFLFPLSTAKHAKRDISYWAGFLQAKVDQLLGEDLEHVVMVVDDPRESENPYGQKRIVLLPSGATQYAVFRNDEEPILLPEIQQALDVSYYEQKKPVTFWVMIQGMDAEGEPVGDAFDYFVDPLLVSEKDEN